RFSLEARLRYLQRASRGHRPRAPSMRRIPYPHEVLPMTDLSSPTTAGRRPSRRRAAKLLAPLLALSLLLPTAAAQTEAGAEPGWELRACADPNLLPFSGREAPGFENRVASLVAEAVGARLTYDWGTFTRDTIDLRFGEGE